MKWFKLVGCPLALAAAMLFTLGCGGEEESTATDSETVQVSLELPGMT